MSFLAVFVPSGNSQMQVLACSKSLDTLHKLILVKTKTESMEHFEPYTDDSYETVQNASNREFYHNQTEFENFLKQLRKLKNDQTTQFNQKTEAPFFTQCVNWDMQHMESFILSTKQDAEFISSVKLGTYLMMNPMNKALICIFAAENGDLDIIQVVQKMNQSKCGFF